MPWGFFPPGPGVVEPAAGCFSQLGFDEGNAEQYVWYVPQNIAGLVTALGGRKAVGDRLDRFTKQLNVGPEEPYLWAGNEPGFDVPWLYNYIGQPWKTQQLVDRVRSKLFTPTPDGEPGNDDLGAMSSWYVWAALGLYPSTPGTSILTVNTPLFDRVEITLPAGKFIKMSAPGASGPNRMKLHQEPSHRRPAHRQDVPSGVDHPRRRRTDVLAFAAARARSGAPPTPPRRRRSARAVRPVTVNVSPAVVDIAPGATGNVTVNAQRMIDGPGGFTITGKSYVPGIKAAKASGQFAADGSGSATVAITVTQSVPDGYYPLVLTTRVGDGTRTFKLLVTVDRD